MFKSFALIILTIINIGLIVTVFLDKQEKKQLLAVSDKLLIVSHELRQEDEHLEKSRFKMLYQSFRVGYSYGANDALNGQFHKSSDEYRWNDFINQCNLKP